MLMNVFMMLRIIVNEPLILKKQLYIYAYEVFKNDHIIVNSLHINVNRHLPNDTSRLPELHWYPTTKLQKIATVASSARPNQTMRRPVYSMNIPAGTVQICTLHMHYPHRGHTAVSKRHVICAVCQQSAVTMIR